MDKMKMDIHLLNKLTLLIFSFVVMKTGQCITSFDLPQNITQNPQSLLSRVRPRVVPPQHTLSTPEPVTIAPSTSNSKAQKTLYDYSTPSATNIPIGLDVSTGGENFEINTGLIMMVHTSPFCGKASEDASTHLQQFSELCSTFVIKRVSQDAIWL